MSRARLFSRFGPTRGLDFTIGDEATIGRSSDCTVRLDDRAISGRHARLLFDAERDAYYLEDLESLNGTRVDGVPVRGRERLERLHLLELGGSCPLLFVRTDRAPAPAAAAQAATEKLSPEPRRAEPPPPSTAAGKAPPEKTSIDREIPMVPAALAEPPAPAPEKTAVEELAAVLPEALAEPGGGGPALRLASGRVLPLAEGDNLVGRGFDAALRIPEPEISRRHAALRLTGGRVTVRDLGSHNHTFLEGERLEPGREVEVTAPARLTFGTIEAQLVQADRGSGG